MLSVKQVSIKYHFLSLWYDSTGLNPNLARPLANTLLIRPMALFFGLVGRVFANGPEDLGSISRSHHTKDFKNGRYLLA